MSPLLPKGKRPWQDDPGHIHDSPAPADLEEMEEVLPLEHQEHTGVDLPAIDSITAQQAAEEAREPHGEPAAVPEPAEVEVPRGLANEIRRAMKRYPEKRSASIPALWAVQRRYGWCSPEGIEQAAAVMGLTPAYLESVATFYDLFHTEPQGEHEVLVCTNISCWLQGGDELLQAFMDAAGTDHPGETSADGKVFVRGFECLGACDIAPMASIDERYYGPLTDEDAAAALKQMRTRRQVLPEKRLQDRDAAGGTGPRVGADSRITRHSLNKVKASAKRKPATRAMAKAAARTKPAARKAAAKKPAAKRAAAPKRKPAAPKKAAAKRRPPVRRKPAAKRKPAATKRAAKRRAR